MMDSVRRRWFDHFKNPVSVVGLVAALAAGVFHLGLFLIDASHRFHNPYLNIWFFIILPPIVFGGVGLAILGAVRTRRRFKSGKGPAPATYSWKGAATTAAVTLLILMPFFGVTSYKGYNYTDSVEFCGQACHVPMGPVFTAYQNSPHARVACSHCHIGEGASWFVRSKLSGVRQVFATLLDSFHRPIETPIKNLRPARETCERCHWPEKAFGSVVVALPHFAANEENSRRPLSMILKTGGGDPTMTEVRGIHWHFQATHRTEYVAVDEDRMDIPWVRVTTSDAVHTYRSDGLSENDPPPEGELRVMDCLDCHNRPSHNYRPPDVLMNNLLDQGFIDQSLPFIKRESARLMAVPYTSTPEARAAIEEGLRTFYRENYPDVITTQADELTEAIAQVIGAFEKNLFPEMNTDWRSHPDHIGHKYSLGCFRCHDDQHVTADDARIRRDCSLCHDFLAHEEEEEGAQVLVRGGYHHPFELGEAHERLNCNICHDGGPTPSPSCTGCHADVDAFMAGSSTALGIEPGAPDPHYGELECIDCHEDQRTFAREETLDLCTECHDEEEILAASTKKFEAIEAALGAAPETPVAKEMSRIPAVHNFEMALRALGLEGVTDDSEK